MSASSASPLALSLLRDVQGWQGCPSAVEAPSLFLALKTVA